MKSESPEISEMSDDQLARLPFRQIAELHSGSLEAFFRPLEWTKDHLKALRCSIEDSGRAQVSHSDSLDDEQHAMEKDIAKELGSLIAVCGFRPARMFAMRDVLEHYSFTYQGDELFLPFGTGKKSKVQLKRHCDIFQSPRRQRERSFLLIHVDYFAIMRSRKAHLPTINQVTEEDMVSDPYIAGLLIALAEKSRQAQIRRKYRDGPHRVHLLLRFFRDNSKMRIYTATVTNKFLNKLKFPGKTPKCPPEETRLEISYVTLRFKPYSSLHQRLMKAIYKQNEDPEDNTWDEKKEIK